MDAVKVMVTETSERLCDLEVVRCVTLEGPSGRGVTLLLSGQAGLSAQVGDEFTLELKPCPK